MIIRTGSDGSRKPRPRKSPRPVKGQQIPLSSRMVALIVLGCAAAFVLGGCLLFKWLRIIYFHLVEKQPYEEHSEFMLIFGLFGLVGAPAVGWIKFRRLRAGRRIVVGADRFQIVEGSGDDLRVLVSVPYENIEVMKLKRQDSGDQLDFEFTDTNDPETYVAGADIEENFLNTGYHYSLTERHQEPMEEIEILINRAWKKWRKARRPDAE